MVENWLDLFCFKFDLFRMKFHLFGLKFVYFCLKYDFFSFKFDQFYLKFDDFVVKQIHRPSAWFCLRLETSFTLWAIRGTKWPVFLEKSQKQQTPQSLLVWKPRDVCNENNTTILRQKCPILQQNRQKQKIHSFCRSGNHGVLFTFVMKTKQTLHCSKWPNWRENCQIPCKKSCQNSRKIRQNQAKQVKFQAKQVKMQAKQVKFQEKSVKFQAKSVKS